MLHRVKEIHLKAAHLVLLHTEEIIGHIEKTLGQVLGRKEPGIKDYKWNKLNRVCVEPRGRGSGYPVAKLVPVLPGPA